MTEEQVMDYIDGFIQRLKPELKNRFVYVFRDFTTKEDAAVLYGHKRYLYGVCDWRMNPPLITFFPRIMSKWRIDEKEIERIVKHEILHALGGQHGDIEAHENSNKMTL